MNSTDYFLFAGAFAKSGALGIQSFSYDCINKSLTRLSTFSKYGSMSCMAIDGDLLFTNVESAADDLLISMRIQQDGSLEELETIHLGSCLIAHLNIERSNRFLFAPSMESSKVSMIGYDENGRMEIKDSVIFDDPGSFTLGKSTNPRQGGSKVHSTFIMPDGKHMNVCNLGSDKVYTLELDMVNGRMKKLPEFTIDFDGGEGPRHILYGNSGKYAYVNTEIGNHIYVYKINENGSMEFLQKISTLDPEKENPPKGETSTTLISRSGKYFFCANRGQANIAGFKIGDDGLLTVKGFYDCYGEMPRGLTFGFNDGVIFCSNNKSGTLTVIDYNVLTGTPGKCLQVIEGIPGAANTVWTEFIHR